MAEIPGDNQRFVDSGRRDFQAKNLTDHIADIGNMITRRNVMADAVKPGWKTSEFWMTAITSVIAILGNLAGIIPTDLAAKVVGVLTGLYTILRTLSKQPTITTLVQK
jgi:hypothetical protein